MRARFSWFAAAFITTLALGLAGASCGGEGGVDPSADEDADGYKAEEDCNDHDPAVNPGATEPCSCDGEDDDCNGTIDDFACDLQCSPPQDVDGDGFEPPADCNDQDPSINPGAEEPCECDTVDQDCSGDPQDFACDMVCHNDFDGDGFDDSQDCDDDDSDVFPGAAEECECDDVDSNCNGDVGDVPAECGIVCTDGDGDGFFAEGGDCDDGNGSINPGAEEPCQCDAIDQDCSGDPQDFPCELDCPDNDGDGSPTGIDCDDNDPDATPGPGPEACNCDGADNECNGVVDDFDASCMKTCTYLGVGEMCTIGVEPACGEGLWCCPGGIPDMETCVVKCTGDMCNGNCPLVP